MTTDAAWRRAIDTMDHEAFQALVADEAIEALGLEFPAPPSGTVGVAVLDEETLRLLIGTAALAGLRRMIESAKLEAALAPADETAVEDALATTLEVVARIRTVLDDPADLAMARTLAANVLVSWNQANAPQPPTT